MCTVSESDIQQDECSSGIECSSVEDVAGWRMYISPSVS